MTRPPFTAMALAFGLALSSSAPAWAATSTEALIDEGVRCYQELNYGCAIDKLGKAVLDLDTGAGSSPDLALRARLHLAFALIAVDRLDDARGQLRKVLQERPAFALDSAVVSPRIVAALEEVRRELIAKSIPQELDPGDPIELPSVPSPPQALYREEVVQQEGSLADGGAEHRWIVDLGAGASFLVGRDAERYQIAPGIAMRLLYRLDDLWVLGLGSQLFVHSVQDLDLEGGAPNSLWALHLQPQVGLSVGVTRWLHVEALGIVGASVFGHDGLSGGAGVELGVQTGLRFRASASLFVSLHVSPVVAIGSAGSETSTSFSLPVTATAGFGF